MLSVLSEPVAELSCHPKRSTRKPPGLFCLGPLSRKVGLLLCLDHFRREIARLVILHVHAALREECEMLLSVRADLVLVEV